MSAAFNGTIMPFAPDENALAELSKLAKLRDQVRQNSHPSLKRRREELESPPHEFVAAAAAAGVTVTKGKEEVRKPKPSEDKLRLEQLLRAKIAAKKAEIGSKTATPNPGSSVPTPTETPAPTLPQQPQFPFPPPPFPFIPGFLPPMPIPIPGMPFPPPIPGLGIPAPPLPQIPSATNTTPSQTTPAPAQVAASTGFGVGPPPPPNAAPPPPPPELAAMIAASTPRPGSGGVAPPPEVVAPPVHAPNVVRSMVEAKVGAGAVAEIGREKAHTSKSPAAKKQKAMIAPSAAAPGRVIPPPTEPERSLPAPGKGDHRSDAKPPTGPAALTNKQARRERDRIEKKARHYSSFDSPPRGCGEVVLPYDMGMGLPYDSAPAPAPVRRASPPRKVEGGKGKDTEKEKVKTKKLAAEDKPAALDSTKNAPSKSAPQTDEPKAPVLAVLDHGTITRQQFPPIHPSQLIRPLDTSAVEDVRMRSPSPPPPRVLRDRDDIRAPRPMGQPVRQPLATEAEQPVQDEHEEYDPTRADLHLPRRRASLGRAREGEGSVYGPGQWEEERYGYERPRFGYEEYYRYGLGPGPGPERRYGYGMDEDRERERGRSLVRRRSPSPPVRRGRSVLSPRHFDRRTMSPSLIAEWQRAAERDPEERERMKKYYPDELIPHLQDPHVRAPSVVPPPRSIRAESRAPPRGAAYGYGSEYGSAAGYPDDHFPMDREHVRDPYVEQRMADLARKRWELEQQERELTRMAMDLSRRHGMNRDREGSVRPPPTSMYGFGHGMEEERNRWGMPPPLPLPLRERERGMYPGRRDGSVYPGGREGSVRPPPVYPGGREASRPPPMRDDEYSPGLGRMMLPPPPPPPPMSYREGSVRPSHGGWDGRMPPPARARAASVRPIASREEYEDRMRYLDRQRREREYEYDHEYPGRGQTGEREWR
ncbi:hypothetical protein SAICODRAFT_148497 [Saitoella complicata NRRL Y-17804]|uniref:uncharacterized protein n=1 Tax=Saitoella complicata (strain BCRC 22490 / CBS 7301 / JCM 7358 / NBRC 10748 / NRRL Y-17804) TaxID=698492 RepID=UPI00086706FA|nr:uncharacterized protein SAICODRAFT_148497 [Saitoella complicata NRRL Y-17804]ODQ55571.1 hypothetical protein SAICODRAFT_148497 [Saitoella complicata NRRL Y-17804]